MTEQNEQNNIKQEITQKSIEAATKSAAPISKFSDARRRPQRGNRGPKGRQEQEEFEQRIIDIARVTRVMAGGKRMRFRACVAIGDKKGRVAIGLAKGADVTAAVAKAVNKAKKEIITVPIVNDTIPHEIKQKYGAAEILFKPARKGRGIIAGGAVRIVMELSGVKNVTSKILGTNNKVNNVKCVLAAMKNLKKVEKPTKEKVEAKNSANNQEEK